MLSFVLLLLLISGAQASYYGVVYSYTVGDPQSDFYPLTNNFKVSFSSCEEFNLWLCDRNCSEFQIYPGDEKGGEWCQTAYIQGLPATFLSTLDYPFSATNWTENRNGIELSKAMLVIEIRNRSDINKPNSSPQTAIIPLLRVPSNCQRNINLLVSDPDGDDIRCRYAAGSECSVCTPPSVLNVSSSCSLSFSPTNSSAEGPYAVLMVVEDFTGQNITLTNGNNTQEVKPQNDAISQIPVQFVFKVDPAAPSCTAGEYLPRFLPPTPEHGAQILTNVNQTLEISVRAEATQAETTELLFSGPFGLNKSSSGSGNFTLTWTPSASDAGQQQTLCFVVQANSSGSVYQSDLRCVFVTTGNSPATVSPLTTMAPLPTAFTFMTIQPLFTTPPPPTTAMTAPPPNTALTPPPPTTAMTPPPPTTATPTTGTTAPPPTTALTPPPPTTATPTTGTTAPPTTTAMTPPPPTTATPTTGTTAPPPTTALTPPPPTTATPTTGTTAPPTTTAMTPPPPTTAMTAPPTTTAMTAPPTTTAMTPPPPTTALTPPPPTTALTPPPPTTATPTTGTTAPPPTTVTPTTATPPPTTTAPPPTTVTPTTATTTTPPPNTSTLSPTTTAPPPIISPPTTIVFPPTTNQPTTTFAPGPYFVLALNMKLSTSLSLENDSAVIINLIKDELRRQGLPGDIIVKLLSGGVVKAIA